MNKLEKTNVILKEIQKSDLDEFYRIANEKGVEKYVGFMYPEDVEDAEVTLDFLMDPEYICFKISESESGNMVGIIFGDEVSEDEIDISFFIGNEYRKKGYCAMAVTLYEEYLKQHTEFKKMQFYIKKKNRKSQNVMKRLGIHEKSRDKYAIIYGKRI